MYATNFSFNGYMLSDFGFIICEFDADNGLKEVQAGTPLTIKTVSRNKGKKYSIADNIYDGALEIQFDICKDPCFNNNNNMVITDNEYLSLCRWLKADGFKQISFFDADKKTIDAVRRYYDGSFNITKLTNADDLIGLRLVVTTNRPYAYSDVVTLSHTFTADSSWTFDDPSYITGTTRPKITIIDASGNLTLTNATYNSAMTINNCSSTETITIDGENMIIQSDDSSHDLFEDFNYEFLKIGNTLESKSNTISSNLACTVTIEYYPIIIDAP